MRHLLLAVVLVMISGTWGYLLRGSCCVRSACAPAPAAVAQAAGPAAGSSAAAPIVTAPASTPPAPLPLSAAGLRAAAAAELARELEADPAYVAARLEELERQILAGAEEQRLGASATARQRVEAELRNERARRVDALRGGTFEFLRRQARDEPMFELLSSGAPLQRFFKPQGAARVHDASRLAPDARLERGDTLLFPRGVHKLRRGLLGRGELPADVTLEGAGMDETAVVMEDEIDSTSDVHNLTLRDLTLHCGDNYMTDLRDAGITLRLERCRIVGFDMGAGGSVMLAADCGLLYASECRFEACFGRSPGSGNLFRVRGGFLARLEACTLVGPFRSVWDDGSATFDRCRFEHVPRRDVERRGNVRLVHCTFEEPTEEQATGRARRPEQRRLAELNPVWNEPRR